MTDSPLYRRKREIETERRAVPLAFDELERAALERLSPDAEAYVTASAGAGETASANRAAFDRFRIVPRVLRDVSDRTLSVELFGETFPYPLMLAPVGGQTKYHEDGELATVRGAADADVPFAVSTASAHTIEAIADERDDATLLFQLYCTPDREETTELVRRAERAGYAGILLTVDFQVPRWAPETAASTNDRLYESTLANVNSDSDDEGTDATSDQLPRDESMTWDDLAFLTAATDLPIYLKGVVHPDDARLAVEHGMDGVVVSNHGGRQIDGSIAALTALTDVVDAVDGAVPVLFDSGVRGGADVFKAVALGADAAFIGRPYVYGLTLAGERGVYEVTHNVLAELDSVLGLSGHDSIADVDRSALVDADERGNSLAR
ncbi:alpha-hydroxy-acid oxidizing protein [Natrarchaeobius oligotrophus]|uniref:Alpha-hydroxy-acid oxidizing protein n=1 Tax=Natrarchaeobius chitinivorans TaxID=1679083 RepID=A0A3N6PLM9_NATCH|nr:alpha-hydroxy-acid oxidizing protein [Natrarchaeobius chitinivorans]RQH02370.1 alpha-hydroxy-acid oxidizing protein [Natrarchaeobius chitinivorans]